MRRAKAEIDTPSKRARLGPAKNPYWQGVSGGRGGVSIGYRKPAAGAGAWVAKVVFEGARVEERIAEADDDGCSSAALPFKAAVGVVLAWSARQHERLADTERSSVAGVPTVKTAIDDYVRSRTSRSTTEGKLAEGRLNRHVLSDKIFSSVALGKLRAVHIDAWRDRLGVRPAGAPVERERGKPTLLAPTSVNRLLNDLRAALNAAADNHRRALPASLPLEIRAGTKALSASSNPRRQLLTDEQTRALIEAAFALDDDGDFGRLVLLAAATGARFSQLKALTVGDVQVAQRRVMMPTSKKGRAARPQSKTAIPLSDGVIERLQTILEDRGPEEILLLRWAYQNSDGARWVRSHRRPWGLSSEIDKSWAAIAGTAELPAGATMYALRHSSVVRALRNGLPTRLVAALHNTSSKMIEDHYAAFIVDATEELARRVTLKV